ncbi:MAG: hypothetical protein AAF414_23355 [Pseudomonadota bacterium]
MKPMIMHGLTRPSVAEPALPEPVRYSAVDRMVISTGRLVVHGLSPCPPIVSTFAILCGAEARDALSAFQIMIRHLRDDGWRRLKIPLSGQDHPPSADEQAVLRLIAAAQAQDMDQLEARLRWLARPHARRQVETAATVVGMALAMNGNFLLAVRS